MNWKNFLTLVSLWFSCIPQADSNVKYRRVFTKDTPIRKTYPSQQITKPIRALQAQKVDNPPQPYATEVVTSAKAVKSHKPKGSASSNTKLGSKTSSAKASSKKHAKRLEKTIKKIAYSIPIKGAVTKRYGRNPLPEGIEITSNQKTVTTAMDGLVIYSGNQLIDYGTLVIVKHPNDTITIYGFLSKSFVKNGQIIKRGQKLGEIRGKLYFELRKNKSHVDPKKYLKF